MKTSVRQAKGLTIVEMMGLLAVITILASMLIPRVFRAIEERKDHIQTTNGVVVDSAITSSNLPFAGVTKVVLVVWVTNHMLLKDSKTRTLWPATNRVGITSVFEYDGPNGRFVPVDSFVSGR